MSEYIVDFGDEKSSAFVGLAMAQAEANGARLCEEIVRCRDCKHYEYCRFHANRPDKPNGFCAWGERANNGRNNV